MNNTTFTGLIILLSSIFLAPGHAATDTDEAGLHIKDAWIAEAPPVSKVMVAYLTITNTAGKAIEVIGAESDLYSSIEFHETVHEDGMARMIRHRSLTVPANDYIELKRGGKHFMLFNPVKTLKAGDIVNIKLTTDNKRTKTISIPVRKP